MSLKLNRIVLTPTQRTKEMILELMDKKGFRSAVQTVEYAIAEIHNKEFPAYVRAKMGYDDTIEQEKARAERKEAKEKVQKEQEEKQKLMIAKKLEGTVYEKDGTRMVDYFTYDGRLRYEQTVPLSVLTEEMIDSQYVPSREHVEKLQAQGKVKYVRN